jgi:hypothetical protein
MLNKIFAYVWYNRLTDWHTGKQSKVIKVRGWRSALIDTPSGQRMGIMFCLFPWE